MPKNLRVFVSPLREGEQQLEFDAAHYLASVHRLESGHGFIAFDPEAGLEADGVLLECAPKRARCRISNVRPSANVSLLSVTLVQGLGKGDKVEQVLRSATALGVSSIAIVETERSVARIRSDREPGKHERWRSILIDAARQSGRGDLPELRGPRTLAQELAEVREDRGLMLCLHPEADAPFSELIEQHPNDAPVTILIGPEGGLSARDLGQARAAGFQEVRFGSFVLRTEIAGIAVLGALIARSA